VLSYVIIIRSDKFDFCARRRKQCVRMMLCAHLSVSFVPTRVTENHLFISRIMSTRNCGEEGSPKRMESITQTEASHWQYHSIITNITGSITNTTGSITNNRKHHKHNRKHHKHNISITNHCSEMSLMNTYYSPLLYCIYTQPCVKSQIHMRNTKPPTVPHFSAANVYLTAHAIGLSNCRRTHYALFPSLSYFSGSHKIPNEDDDFMRVADWLQMTHYAAQAPNARLTNHHNA
jgi:hypothetical protein